MNLTKIVGYVMMYKSLKYGLDKFYTHMIVYQTPQCPRRFLGTLKLTHGHTPKEEKITIFMDS
ncbi:hypothetical protein AGMMS49950_04040 [Endomicrobiia bacterium]|nr:hypothetical protein AGMMS49950_04040 [Endomicrobiia bacterium]